MATGQRVNERLAAITEAGTSIWLDQVRRSLVETGELQRMVEEESLRGVTSNPAIFEKAILGSRTTTTSSRSSRARGGDTRGIYRRDGDPGRPARPATCCARLGGDGPLRRLRLARGRPDLAFDTTEHARAGARVLGAVDRPNLMIKIPAPTRASRRSSRRSTRA
jgi:hypothetical protein